jgi:F420-dependent oxidoreductase-like protein
MDIRLMIEGEAGVTWPQWVALAHACEQHGLALFRDDHYMNLDGYHPDHCALDAWSTLAGLAAVTSTVRLGTMVTAATFRHPSVLAKMVTTVDHISGGRVELGIGAGWHVGEHAAYGFPFRSLGTRLAVLDEQLQVIVGHWGDAPFSFEGAHYRLDDLRAEPKPMQRPRPPIILGGDAGPKSAALGARFADEYNTELSSLEQVLARKANVAAACDRAGRAPIPFSILTTAVVGADERDLGLRLERAKILAGDLPVSVIATPLDAWVIGTVESLAEQLAPFRNAGISRFYCQHLAHDDVESVALLGEVAQLLA